MGLCDAKSGRHDLCVIQVWGSPVLTGMNSSTRVFRTVRALLPQLLACSLLACDGGGGDAEPDESWAYPEAGKEDALADGPNPTTDRGVEIFRGYNVVTDNALGIECVEPRARRYRAGATAWSETMTVVESLEEFHSALGIDAKAQVKAGPLGVDAGGSFNNEFTSNENTLTLLLRARASYGVVNRDPVALTEDALALAQSSPAEFARHCGTHFIEGVEYGAELRVLISVETESFRDKEEIKSQLAASGISAGPATVGAELKTSVSEILEQRASRISAKAEAFGFNTSASLAAIEGNPLDSAAGLVEKIKTDLNTSIDADQCADGGGCASESIGGYEDNSNRSAAPVGVSKRTYRTATNFPKDTASLEAFRAHDNQIAGALTNVEKHARAYATVSSIYHQEIGAILESEVPYDFAIYGTGEFGSSAANQQKLIERAAQMRDVFNLDDGEAVALISDSIATCWDRAVQGDFTGCDETELDRVDALLDDYAERRIRPVYYLLPSDETVEWQDAECPDKTRLPDRFEASRLYAAVRRNQTIPEPRYTEEYFENENFGIWVREPGFCAQDEGAWVQFKANTLAAGCYENRLATVDIELPVLCVPTAGPFGASVREL